MAGANHHSIRLFDRFKHNSCVLKSTSFYYIGLRSKDNLLWYTIMEQTTVTAYISKFILNNAT
jgi:hypothetical protein